MRVIPFGTSSGRPTSDRNVSALAVDLGPQWILVDCGEATQHQVMRSPLRPSRLALIAITHLHGDHVLGLPGLLSSLAIDGRTDPLPIVGPVGLADWLAATAATPIMQLPFALDLTTLDDDDDDNDDQRVADGELQVVADESWARVETLPLRHRVPTFGYRIAEPDRAGHLDVDEARRLGVTEGPELGRLRRGEAVMGRNGPVLPDAVIGPDRPGRVVTVLGDTTPCTAGVRLALEATLLVHEATYATADAALAEEWKHSTAAGAASVARDARADRLLITHFSARYADAQVLLDDARAVFAATDVAVELQPVEL